MPRFIRLSPDVFTVGVYDKNGQIYEVLKPDIIAEFDRVDGRNCGFQLARRRRQSRGKSDAKVIRTKPALPSVCDGESMSFLGACGRAGVATGVAIGTPTYMCWYFAKRRETLLPSSALARLVVLRFLRVNQRGR